jgi:hypothetical protein
MGSPQRLAIMSPPMAPDGPEPREPSSRPERDLPDFLRGQMRAWLEQVAEEGKTAELFELEMWLRSFERFVRI